MAKKSTMKDTMNQLKELQYHVKDKVLYILQSLRIIGAEKNIKDIEPLFRGIAVDRMSGVPTVNDQLGQGFYPAQVGLMVSLMLSASEMLHDTYPDELTLEDGSKMKIQKRNHVYDFGIKFAVATGSHKGFRAEKTSSVLTSWKPSSRPLDMDPYSDQEEDLVYETDDDDDDDKKKK